MKHLSKKVKILLLTTIVGISTYGQNYELNKNVFFNDISNLYVHQSKPFNGVTINTGKIHNYSLGKIQKKVIQFKNGRVEGLIYSINEIGDTLNKFTLTNNLVNGYFSFIFEYGKLYKVTGNTVNDTLSGKIRCYEFNRKIRKWEIYYEGTFSKFGGNPVDDFKKYMGGQLITIVRPFSDHIGLLYFDKYKLKQFINDVDFYEIGKMSMLEGFMVDEGVNYISSPGWSSNLKQYLYKNGNFIGFLIYNTGSRDMVGKYDYKYYKTFYYLNGEYENGFNIKSYTKNQFIKLMELFKNNHLEYTYSTNGNKLLHRKNFINGKLDGQFIDIFYRTGNLIFEQENLRTVFKDGIEIGPIVEYNSSNSIMYKIDRVINDKFDGNFSIYKFSNLNIPILSCSFVNGEINYPLTKYYENSFKYLEIKKNNNIFSYNEYFIDGSLKVSKEINDFELNEIMFKNINYFLEKNKKIDFFNLNDIPLLYKSNLQDGILNEKELMEIEMRIEKIDQSFDVF